MKLTFLLAILFMAVGAHAETAPAPVPTPLWWSQYALLKTKEATLAQLVAADASLKPETLDSLPPDGPVQSLKTKGAINSFSAAGKSFSRLLRKVDLKKTEYGNYKLNWDPIQESNGYYYQCTDNGLIVFYAKKSDHRVFLHFVPHAG